ncbi:MAG: amidohydrolase [Planctomycetota bacterium]|nr:MAG: amidohydrolase [Planctomycetota bacterium]REK31524.1 MAG: amidohydrolase [Planctomycetota bacterium]
MAVDCLFKHAHLFTLAGEGVGYIPDGAVAVTGNRIIAVGDTNQVLADLAAAGNGVIKQEIDATHQALLPGLIDAHIHTQLGLLRGVAQDMHDWMMQGVLPYMLELKPRWQILSSQLTVMEALRAGTTTFGDFLVFPDPALMEFYLSSGIRVRPILPVFEIGPELLAGGKLYQLDDHMGQASYNEALRLYAEYHGAADGRIQCMMGPFAPDFISEKTLVKCKDAAAAKGLPIQMHTAQGDRETEQMEMRYKKRTIPYLDEHEYLDPEFTAVHMTMANNDEVHQVAEAGSKLVVCNGSIGLIDGMIPPAIPFQEAGGTVGLGSDQAAGNNNCNVFNEMKLTAFFGKMRNQDPTAMPADRALRMATIDGAKALGLEDEIGSLEVGKKADLILVDTRHPTLQPVIEAPFNLTANLVYAARGNEVSFVMIDGRVVFDDGKLQTMDEDAVIQEIRETVPSRRKKVGFM